MNIMASIEIEVGGDHHSPLGFRDQEGVIWAAVKKDFNYPGATPRPSGDNIIDRCVWHHLLKIQKTLLVTMTRWDWL